MNINVGFRFFLVGTMVSSLGASIDVPGGTKRIVPIELVGIPTNMIVTSKIFGLEKINWHH